MDRFEPDGVDENVVYVVVAKREGHEGFSQPLSIHRIWREASDQVDKLNQVQTISKQSLVKDNPQASGRKV